MVDVWRHGHDTWQVHCGTQGPTVPHHCHPPPFPPTPPCPASTVALHSHTSWSCQYWLRNVLHVFTSVTLNAFTRYTLLRSLRAASRPLLGTASTGDTWHSSDGMSVVYESESPTDANTLLRIRSRKAVGLNVTASLLQLAGRRRYFSQSLGRFRGLARQLMGPTVLRNGQSAPYGALLPVAQSLREKLHSPGEACDGRTTPAAEGESDSAIGDGIAMSSASSTAVAARRVTDGRRLVDGRSATAT
eukprot:TRINITY_DN9842_c0_g1_i2.p1 TRINITY_DN9842_c0_g1~~TRINITY_DN9842_c0_g1_i2.p1  ORF type:complete len:258 (+),score=-29.99 TRINITY_DN9842_c0_g1_i2:39-776(+)